MRDDREHHLDDRRQAQPDPRPRPDRQSRGAPPRAARQPDPQERVLWDALRGRRLDGVKFRRRARMGAFVLDFYAPELRLVVELDGEVHDNPERRARDQRRDAHLAANGYHVLRVTNMRVVVNLPGVLETIGAAIDQLRAAITLTPDPSPRIGRGEDDDEKE